MSKVKLVIIHKMYLILLVITKYRWVKVTRSKEGHLGLKVDHSEGKSDFLKQVLKNITYRLPIIKRPNRKYILRK